MATCGPKRHPIPNSTIPFPDGVGLQAYGEQYGTLMVPKWYAVPDTCLDLKSEIDLFEVCRGCCNVVQRLGKEKPLV